MSATSPSARVWHAPVRCPHCAASHIAYWRNAAPPPLGRWLVFACPTHGARVLISPAGPWGEIVDPRPDADALDARLFHL